MNHLIPLEFQNGFFVDNYWFICSLHQNKSKDLLTQCRLKHQEVIVYSIRRRKNFDTEYFYNFLYQQIKKVIFRLDLFNYQKLRCISGLLIINHGVD